MTKAGVVPQQGNPPNLKAGRATGDKSPADTAARPGFQALLDAVPGARLKHNRLPSLTVGPPAAAPLDGKPWKSAAKTAAPDDAAHHPVLPADPTSADEGLATVISEFLSTHLPGHVGPNAHQRHPVRPAEDARVPAQEHAAWQGRAVQEDAAALVPKILVTHRETHLAPALDRWAVATQAAAASEEPGALREIGARNGVDQIQLSSRPGAALGDSDRTLGSGRDRQAPPHVLAGAGQPAAASGADGRFGSSPDLPNERPTRLSDAQANHRPAVPEVPARVPHTQINRDASVIPAGHSGPASFSVHARTSQEAAPAAALLGSEVAQSKEPRGELPGSSRAPQADEASGSARISPRLDQDLSLAADKLDNRTARPIPVSGAVKTIELPVAGASPVQAIAQLIQAEAPPLQPVQAPGAAPAATLRRDAVKVLHVQLQPADLGTVNIKMRLVGNALEIRLEPSQEATAALLRQDDGALKAVLAASGFAPDVVTVVSPERSGSEPAGPLGQLFAGQNPEASADRPGAWGARDDGRPASQGRERPPFQHPQRSSDSDEPPVAKPGARDLYL